MQLGELIGSGRDADVYALNENWVLRRNRDGRSQAGEAAVMAHLHAHGYPVPEIHPAPADTPADLVMRRVEGPTLLDAVLAGQIGVAEVGATLAELLVRLHAVPPRGAAGTGTGTGTGTAILHLDLHPLNVIRAADGPVVIDWSNTREGTPAQDWAMSALILAQVSQDGSELSRAAAELLPVLLSHRPAAIVLDAGVMAWARDERAADPNHPPGDLDAAVALVIARAG
ncbi:aminoglycoside phosphotransferase (APT) family kinase protein [Catenulispora sp. MAP5-51]|uniref:phosphotransferase n=1 Tax=Catenulispora sp. MAP5-51 TaxID=3156298 RepID=UPI0035152510